MIKAFPEKSSNTVNLCQHHVQKWVLVRSLPPPSQSQWAKELLPSHCLDHTYVERCPRFCLVSLSHLLINTYRNKPQGMGHCFITIMAVTTSLAQPLWLLPQYPSSQELLRNTVCFLKGEQLYR